MNGVLIGGGMGKLIGRWIGNRRIKKEEEKEGGRDEQRDEWLK